MTLRTSVVLFIFCFICFLIVSLPTQVPASLLGRAVPGISYGSTSGTLWRGAMKELQINAVRAGDVDLAVSPFPLLMLRAGVMWEANGPDLAGAGQAWQSLLGTTGLKANNLEVSAGAMIPWLPIFGTVQVNDLDVVMARSGCKRASGKIATDVLQRSERTLNWQGPPLSGAIQCIGDELVLQMAGRDQTVGLDARAAIRPDGSFQQDIIVQTNEAQIGLALMGFGFTLVDDAYRLRMVGRWRG